MDALLDAILELPKPVASLERPLQLQISNLGAVSMPRANRPQMAPNGAYVAYMHRAACPLTIRASIAPRRLSAGSVRTSVNARTSGLIATNYH